MYIYVIYTYTILYMQYIALLHPCDCTLHQPVQFAKNFAERATVAVAQRVTAVYCPCTLTGIFECWECHRGFFPASSSSSVLALSLRWKKHLIAWTRTVCLFLHHILLRCFCSVGETSVFAFFVSGWVSG